MHPHLFLSLSPVRTSSSPLLLQCRTHPRTHEAQAHLNRLVLHVVLARYDHRDDAVVLLDVVVHHVADEADELCVLLVFHTRDESGQIDEGEVADVGPLNTHGTRQAWNTGLQSPSQGWHLAKEVDLLFALFVLRGLAMIPIGQICVGEVTDAEPLSTHETRPAEAKR